MSHVRRERYPWWYVRYACGSCKARYLVDHTERAAKACECKDYARIPATESEIRDYQPTLFL